MSAGQFTVSGLKGLDSVASVTLSSSGYPAGSPVGSYLITPSNAAGTGLTNYNITYNNGMLVVNADTTMLTYTGATNSPYGTCTAVNLSAVLVDAINGLPVGGATITFTLGVQTFTAVTDSTGTAKVTANVTQSVGGYTVSAAYGGGATTAPSNTSGPYTITQSPLIGPLAGQSLYTGPLLVWTSSSTNNTASVTLSTTLTNSDCGDIRTSKVTFAMRAPGSSSYTPIPSATNLPVGLVSPTVPNVGTASAIVQLSTGNSTYTQFDIAVIVGGSPNNGNYSLNNPAYDQLVTVAEPGKAASILGDGVVDLNASYYAAGYLATGAGGSASAIPSGTNNYLKVQAGVTYNKSFTNLQGKVVVYLNTYNKPDGSVDTVLHTYLIQSNSISGLTAPVPGVYNFTGKASVIDVTGGGSVSVDGGATFQMTTVNTGVTYNNTAFQYGGIQLQVQSKSGNVWIAAGWNGTQPQMKQQLNNMGGVLGN